MRLLLLLLLLLLFFGFGFHVSPVHSQEQFLYLPIIIKSGDALFPLSAVSSDCGIWSDSICVTVNGVRYDVVSGSTTTVASEPIYNPLIVLFRRRAGNWEWSSNLPSGEITICGDTFPLTDFVTGDELLCSPVDTFVLDAPNRFGVAIIGDLVTDPTPTPPFLSTQTPTPTPTVTQIPTPTVTQTPTPIATQIPNPVLIDIATQIALDSERDMQYQEYSAFSFGLMSLAMASSLAALFILAVKK